MSALIDFVYESNKVATPTDLTSSLLRFIGSLGMTRFLMAEYSNHSTAEQESKFGLWTNYPQEWLSRYRDRHHVRHDPVYRMASKPGGPFRWEDATAAYSTTAAIRVMNEAKDFQICSGIGISFRRPHGQVIGFGFANSENKLNDDKNRLSVLQLAAYHSYLVYADLLKLNETEPGASLITEREREVLRWISAGKKKSEIADILMVSESCIKHHCESVFTKLKVNSLAFAVAKALKAGIIDFP